MIFQEKENMIDFVGKLIVTSEMIGPFGGADEMPDPRPVLVDLVPMQEMEYHHSDVDNP